MENTNEKNAGIKPQKNDLSENVKESDTGKKHDDTGTDPNRYHPEKFEKTPDEGSSQTETNR